MADREICKWTGASGISYKFYVFEGNPQVRSDQSGNFIYARRNEDGKWIPIYMGEGDLAVRCARDKPQLDCIERMGATHVHMHVNADPRSRKEEETDLLARYTNAFAPRGCNVKLHS